jgi:hypothetical protein
MDFETFIPFMPVEQSTLETLDLICHVVNHTRWFRADVPSCQRGKGAQSFRSLVDSASAAVQQLAPADRTRSGDVHADGRRQQGVSAWPR